jgi:chitodextrinase
MINAVNRVDLVEDNDELLIGICQANFSSDTAYVEFDNFSVLTFDPDLIDPTVPGAATASNITSTTLDLEFGSSSDNTGILNYDVMQDGEVISTQDTLTLAVTGLTAETEYTFTVIARDLSGNASDASEALVVSTLAEIDTEAPTAPANLNGTNIAITSLDLTWDASTDNVAVTGYIIYQDDDSIAEVVNPGYSVSGLSAETEYTFHVIAKDAAGNKSDPSSDYTVTTLPTSVEEVESGIFTMYPNPASDEVVLDMVSNEYAELNVYNSQGKLIFSDHFRNRTILHLDQLGSKGMYIVRITTSASTTSRSLIFR